MLFVVALSTIKVLDDSFGRTRFASSFHLRHGNFRYHDWNHEGNGVVVESNDSLCQMLNIAPSYHHDLSITEEALELRTLHAVNGFSHPTTFL